MGVVKTVKPTAKDLFYMSIIGVLLLLNIAMYFNVLTLLDRYNELSVEYEALDQEYRELLGMLMEIRRLNGSEDLYMGWDVNWWIVGVAFDGGKLFGVVMDFQMSVRPGSGRVYIDLDTPIGLDLQESLIIAKYVVSTALNIDLDRYDIVLRIEAPQGAAAVDGPSAGLALAIALASVFLDDVTLDNVCVTGALNIYGGVDKVGGVLEKALACAEEGIDVVLVPEGQSVVTVPREEIIEIFPGFGFRMVVEEEYPLEMVLMDEYGYRVRVVEVSSFMDAINVLRGLGDA